MPNGLFSSSSLSLVGDNTLMPEVRVMAAIELHVNETYYAQHPALKSLYEKSQTGGWLSYFPLMIQCLN